ncbi:MAG: site-specific integrase [Vulcanimicrobiaceae bacterium]
MFREFVRPHVAGGGAAADTVTGYMREARLFRDRFLAPRGLALAALTEDDVVAYRRELVEVGYATTIGTKLSALRRLLDAVSGRGRSPRTRPRTLVRRAIAGTPAARRRGPSSFLKRRRSSPRPPGPRRSPCAIEP